MQRDRLRQFVHAHVRSRVQRAVYATLGGSPEVPLSAHEIAALAHADAYEVDVALRQYAMAGIVEVITSDLGPVTYRWRDEMRYLFEGVPTPGSEEFLDPVCGMPVDTDTGYLLDDSPGQPIRFCSLRCLMIFQSRAGTSEG
jgi:YHS domain-containing protein